MKKEKVIQEDTMIGYESEYWKFQKEIGGTNFHALIQKSRVQRYIKATDTVLDFGCGGGFTLKEIDCKDRYGVEINPSAAEQAKRNGITVKSSLQEYESDFFDAIYSNSALEHVPNPHEILVECLRVLKKGGTLILSVPHEELSVKYYPNDINQHLFTWAPMNIGNLVKYSGFQIIEVKAIKVVRPPGPSLVFNLFGASGFNRIGRLYRGFRYMIKGVKNIGSSADVLTIARK